MFLLSVSLSPEVRVFLEGGGREVEENGTSVQRSVQFTISRDESVTLNRDVTVAFSTADDSATGNHNPLTV